jgi:predicted transposase/invertase (TIGR01784 family)
MPKSKPPKNESTGPVTGKYIDPLVDFAFKKIFGSEPNKDLLIDFLNEVFRGRKQIIDLVYNKNEHPGDIKDEGAVIFDLLCTGDKGERFLIEVQRATQGYFKERALFYTSRLISDQAPKGKRSGVMRLMKFILLRCWKISYCQAVLRALICMIFASATGIPAKYFTTN